jgi:hypothetical protein
MMSASKLTSIPEGLSNLSHLMTSAYFSPLVSQISQQNTPHYRRLGLEGQRLTSPGVQQGYSSGQKFVEEGDPIKQLKLILDGSDEAVNRDDLYRKILDVSFPKVRHDMLEAFKIIVGSIILAKTQLTRNGLKGLHGDTVNGLCFEQAIPCNFRKCAQRSSPNEPSIIRRLPDGYGTKFEIIPYQSHRTPLAGRKALFAGDEREPQIQYLWAGNILLPQRRLSNATYHESDSATSLICLSVLGSASSRG